MTAVYMAKSSVTSVGEADYSRPKHLASRRDHRIHAEVLKTYPMRQVRSRPSRPFPPRSPSRMSPRSPPAALSRSKKPGDLERLVR